mmetsp:Transcript_27856/g.86331  ORF Transcript_27856/g.86331 Transcript_27856/m.86331 type:complete len:363 (-) Transcript_27856:539-1627(-)
MAHVPHLLRLLAADVAAEVDAAHLPGARGEPRVVVDEVHAHLLARPEPEAHRAARVRHAVHAPRVDCGAAWEVEAVEELVLLRVERIPLGLARREDGLTVGGDEVRAHQVARLVHMEELAEDGDVPLPPQGALAGAVVVKGGVPGLDQVRRLHDRVRGDEHARVVHARRRAGAGREHLDAGVVNEARHEVRIVVVDFDVVRVKVHPEANVLREDEGRVRRRDGVQIDGEPLAVGVVVALDDHVVQVRPARLGRYEHVEGNDLPPAVALAAHARGVRVQRLRGRDGEVAGAPFKHFDVRIRPERRQTVRRCAEDVHGEERAVRAPVVGERSVGSPRHKELGGAVVRAARDRAVLVERRRDQFS